MSPPTFLAAAIVFSVADLSEKGCVPQAGQDLFIAF
jgi:hypothetical protein